MRLGVLDIGSNTVHLLLVDAHPGARPVPFASHKRPLSLVQFLDDDGNINDAGQHELVEFVLEAWEFAAKHKADDLLAFCTSAIREATNGPEVLARVKHETTITLRELTGSEEASMTFFAVRRWYGWGAGPILNLDIGGGSFEMALGQDELPELAMSVPLGASRLTRDWLPEDPPSAKSIKELRRYIRSTLKPAVRKFEKLGRPNLVAGTSKTFRSLARIAGAAPSAAGPYVKRELLSLDLGLWTQRISAMEVEDRLHLPGVSEARARQVLAGALVAEAALELFGFTTMEICPWALREGLILRRLDQLVFEGPLQPAPHVAREPAGQLDS
ncbi:Ppx/GppA phosphatase family protein [Arthrobacter sp. ov118]|jgi:exopolyphosphatase/guanosine-5'-triphosphate,3'-diphosphate pyrophosphatase|uniref:Ppx/GppA phosphatase family protein n=1 Tax=Arthrobacter sp. ov118 TaxID=1761747 RepID=UPI0008E9F2BA|nr:Ppx/GppA phosphatase family protein [Arthrobacter sp. ov118]SFT49398.1 Ppx/GppA phosphatase [Arthrobacter sp. ov118]